MARAVTLEQEIRWDLYTRQRQDRQLGVRCNSILVNLLSLSFIVPF